MEDAPTATLTQELLLMENGANLITAMTDKCQVRMEIVLTAQTIPEPKVMVQNVTQIHAILDKRLTDQEHANTAHFMNLYAHQIEDVAPNQAAE